MPKRANPPSGGAPGTSLPFPKSARILRSADFRAVYDQGFRVSSPLFAAFCFARADGAPLKPRPSGRGWRRDGSPMRGSQTEIAKSAIQDAIQGPRLGVTATRALGGAVVRNRVKRRLREAFRMHRSGLASHWDIVINPRRAAIDASFAEIERALMKVIARCEQ